MKDKLTVFVVAFFNAAKRDLIGFCDGDDSIHCIECFYGGKAQWIDVSFGAELIVVMIGVSGAEWICFGNEALSLIKLKTVAAERNFGDAVVRFIVLVRGVAMSAPLTSDSIK